MTHPLSVLDFAGRERVAPSVDVALSVVENGRQPLINPFVVTYIGQFLYGPLNELESSPDLESYRRLRDPERRGDSVATTGEYAFRPASTPIPRGTPLMRTIRVGAGAHAPTASSLALANDTPATAITVTSRGKGAWTKQLRVRYAVESGARNVYLGFRSDPTYTKVGQNLGPLFTLNYSGGGAETATYTVTAAVAGSATVLATALGDGAAAGTANLSIDLTDAASFPSVAALIAYINRQPGYSAVQIASDVDLDRLSPRELDAAAGVDINGAAKPTVTANIGAAVLWINDNGATIGPVEGVSAVRAAVADPPESMDGWAYLTSGADAANIDATDYLAALAVIGLADVDAGLLILDTSDATIRAAVVEWIDGQRELKRYWRAVFAMPAATTDAAAQAAAGAIGRHWIALVHQRVTDVADASVTHPPVRLAAMMAGVTAGINAQNDVQSIPVTGRPLRAGAILATDVRSQAQRDALIKAGVTPIHVQQGAVIITMAVSTDQGPIAAWRRWEEATMLDWIAYSLYQTLKPRSIAWAEPEYVALTKRAVIARLATWKDARVLVDGTDPETGAAVPAWAPPVITVGAGVTEVTVEMGMGGMIYHTRLLGTVRKVTLTAAATA